MQYRSVTQGAFFFATTRAVLAPSKTVLLRTRSATTLCTLHGRRTGQGRRRLPLIVWLTPKSAKESASDAEEVAVTTDGIDVPPAQATPALLLQADGVTVLAVEPDDNAPRTISVAKFATLHRPYHPHHPQGRTRRRRRQRKTGTPIAPRWLSLVHSGTAVLQEALAGSSARLTGNPTDCTRNAALHPGHHRQGARSPHKKHPYRYRYRYRHGRFHAVFGRAILAASIPCLAHR